MAKSKKPTGVTVTRSGNNYTAKWICGDKDYLGGQQLRYRAYIGTFGTSNFQWTEWTYKTVSASQRSAALNNAFALTDFYPYYNKVLAIVQVEVRGNRKDYTTTKGSGAKKKTTKHSFTWSDWTHGNYNFAVPNLPTITAELDSELANKTLFSWSSANNKENQPLVDYQYQSILVTDSNETDGSKLTWDSSNAGWRTGTGSSVAIAESATGSHTRWVRVRARNCRGVTSPWRYAKHVYATPNEPDNVELPTASVEVHPSYYRVSLHWNNPSDAAHPVDAILVQYAIAVPTATMGCPSSATWNDGARLAPKQGTDGYTFTINDTLDADECLFLRVTAQHDTDTNISPSDAILALRGALANPTALSVTTDDSTHKATVTATNNSTVPGAFLAITYRTTNVEESFIVGVIPNGQSSATVQCPDWSQETAVAFGVQAIVGTATAKTRADGVTSYSLDVEMESLTTLWSGGTVPVAPTGITAAPTDREGTVKLTWNWSWEDANKAIISWADHSDAWESTSEPSSYEVGNIHAASWNVAGLETGKTWYFRVRLIQETANGTTYGPWSAMASVDLSSAPAVPTLLLDKAVITEDGTVTASWGYSSTDGTSQAYAEICTATISGGGIVYGNVIAHTLTAQHITLSAAELAWTAGQTYLLCVRVVSASGKVSDGWSAPVSVAVAEPLTAAITQSSLVASGGAYELQTMPLTVTVTGAGTGGTTLLAIERAQDYQMARPDGETTNGFENETVLLMEQTGETQMTVNVADLLGALDDGARYRIVATVKDGFGQSAETTREFTVNWSHQALVPTATIALDRKYNAVKITPIPPNGTVEGDTFDIYRLTADAPELIVRDGGWNTTYVDPYPAIRELGGHRVVFKTANGDYITAENDLAWYDTNEEQGDFLDLDYSIIDFGTGTVQGHFNLELSASFEKDFNLTEYLGGSIVGDWNEGVKRAGSLKFDTTEEDPELIEAIRALARYAGVCHVRTPDGSSYTADVEVSEDRNYKEAGKVVSYTLTVTKVDVQELDGMTLAEWEEMHPEEPEEDNDGIRQRVYE